MELTIIYPRFKYDTYGGLEEPMGILYVSGVLKQAGHKVHVFDLTFADDLKVLDDAIKSSQVVGLSSTTQLFGISQMVARYCRKINPQIITVLGGPHATLGTEETLRRGFDIAVIGEAESSIRELIAGIEKGDWKNTRGIAYLEDGEMMHTPPVDMIQDLDDIPFPVRDCIDYGKYPFFGLVTTRGCPFQCNFCKPLHSHLFGKRIRKRTVTNVLDEIEQLQRIDPHKSFEMKDDLFTMHPSHWIEELRDGLRERKLKISYTCASRVDTVDERKLILLKESGCTSLSFGVESGSQKVLDFYQKGTTVKKIEQTFELCHKYDMHTHAYLMIGAPVETREDLEMTYQLVKKIRPHSWMVYITSPFPGNHLYDYAKEKGIIKAKSYEELDNALNSRNLVTPMELEHLNAADLKEYRDKINRFMVRHVVTSRIKSTLTNPGKHLRKLVTQPREVTHFVKQVLERFSV